MRALIPLSGVYFFILAIYSVVFNGDAWLYFLLNGSVLYGVHRFGHHALFGTWYTAHTMGHHVYAYPNERFQQRLYRKNRIDRWQLNTWLYVFATIACLAPFRFAPSLVALSLVFLGIENEMHKLMHSTNTAWWDQWSWFRDLRAIHKHHHTYPYDCNYAVAAIFFDALYGTLRM